MEVEMTQIKIKMHEGCQDLFPSRAHPGDAGFDLSSRIDILLYPDQTSLVPTGVYLELPEGWEAQIRPRSGMSLKTKVIIPNSPGTSDSSYRGELNAILRNTGKEAFLVSRGMRIAQMIIQQLPEIELVQVKELNETERGAKGFGSSGT